MRLRPVSPVFAALALATCAAAPASAQWTRHHASECVPQIEHALLGFVVDSAGVTHVSDSNSAMDLVCPSDDWDGAPDDEVTEVRVYVYDASPTEGVTVAACADLSDWQGTADCSTLRKTSDDFVGAAVITLSGHDLAPWRRDLTFGYLHITVPPRSGATGFSYVKGWITQH